MGFGTSPYGISPYGGVFAATTITVAAAWAITTHSVRVTLTTEPLHVDQFQVGDAQNPLTWSVVNNETGAVLTVASATMHDTLSVDLVTLEALGDHLESHTVTAIGLFSADEVLVTSPASADFSGVVQTMDPTDQRSTNDFRDRDFANPPFQISRGLGAGGTLVIGDDGDFATESGRPLVRKLVIRRLTTRRGAFRHLPEYGVELEPKEPIASGGDLQAVLRDIEAQAQQEPDVVRAVARGSVDRSGVAIIQLSIQAKGGVSVNMRMGAVAGRLVEM